MSRRFFPGVFRCFLVHYRALTAVLFRRCIIGLAEAVEADKKSLVLMMGGSVTDFGPEQIAALKTGVEAKLGVPITVRR